jgi:amino acid transporter
MKKMGFLWNMASYDVYFSWSIVGMIFSIIQTILNLIGVKPSAIFQVSATIGLAIAGLAFFFGGVAFGDTKNLTPLWTNGAGMVSVMLMAPSMYVGFDVIPQSAEEMNITLKTIGKILIFSVFLTATWYILMILGISLSAPEEIRMTAKVPVADAMAYAYKSPIG